jgi:ubiquinone/menaquinone biosynthesis C-methylase UbiE
LSTSVNLCDEWHGRTYPRVIPASTYPLGNSDAEHARLIRQAEHLQPLTERLFREAGIRAGQRVLDLGSGVGDVAMLAAALVGPSGFVVGIERDPVSITRARSRIAEAGLENVRIVEGDATSLCLDESFDAAVGRFILGFLPDPIAVVRSVAALVRPGGIVAFHEPAWAPALAVAPQLPLWTAAASLVRDTLNRSGADANIGLALHRIFRQAGLPTPTACVEMPIGNDARFTRRIVDVLQTLRSRAAELGLRPERLGNFDTLGARLDEEIAKADVVIPYGVGLVAAWARTPQPAERG